MTFNQSTQAENLAELRRRFREAKAVDAAKIARWIVNNLTAAQVKAIFGLTDAQVAALRTRFLALRDHWNAVEAATGE